MSTAIVKPDSGLTAESMETVLVKGDLSGLKPAERVQYYRSVCESLGLNPLTQPFAYITLNGKLTLYAKRDCTDQLRRLQNISIVIPSREVIEGCYVVTARAKNPLGREDESLGAVPIENLKGESRSNAMMKAETKAKRRVTLSICGLAFLDESELESIQGASHVIVNAAGEVTSGTKEAAAKMAATKLEQLHAGVPYAQISTASDEAAPESIQQSVEQTRADKQKTKHSARYITMLKAFGKLKERCTAIDAVSMYYRNLGACGYEHSNDFPDTTLGFEAALNCHDAIVHELASLETAAQKEAE